LSKRGSKVKQFTVEYWKDEGWKKIKMLKPNYDITALTSIIEMDARVKFAYLFGSLARKEDNSLSDIDIAVYLGDDCEPASAKFDIIGKMMDVLGDNRFDLVILNKAPLTLAVRIVSCREILVDREPFLRHRYESQILREYFYFSRLENAILNRRYALG